MREVNQLFSQTSRHPKVVKNGIELNVYTLIMHLAPADRSGYEVCPMRSAGCTAACLNTAGYKYKNKDGTSKKEAARIARTKLFFEDRETFMDRMHDEIWRGARYAEKHSYLFGVRLNGTSDIPWENIPYGKWKNIMERFSSIKFYDYTKRHNRKNLPSNYRLTFSRSEDNKRDCWKAMDNGMNVAVVFNTPKNEPLPAWWDDGYCLRRVIDGDVSDWRFDDPANVIVGLRAKGDAKKDQTGFVVRV